MMNWLWWKIKVILPPVPHEWEQTYTVISM